MSAVEGSQQQWLVERETAQSLVAEPLLVVEPSQVVEQPWSVPSSYPCGSENLALLGVVLVEHAVVQALAGACGVGKAIVVAGEG